MKYPMKEVEVKDKYPDALLHDITKNRICMTVGQLERILNENKEFGNNFIDLCKNQLKFKKQQSLDFYDLSNIIDVCYKKKLSLNEEILSLKKKIFSLDERLTILEKKQKEAEEFTFAK